MKRINEEYLKRDHANKEKILYSYKESTNRQKWKNGDVLDQHKKDDQLRIRDNLGDHHFFQTQRWE